MEDEVITVAELVELLQSLPQDLPVDVEGCDCVGAAIGIEANRPSVLIRRAYGISRGEVVRPNRS